MTPEANNSEIPRVPGDIDHDDVPSQFPDAPDVFTTVAPAAVKMAEGLLENGDDLELAAAAAADATNDEYLHYEGSMQEQARDALEQFIVETLEDSR